MKTIWKALGIAALAAVVPVRFKKDEETGKKTFQSLLWKLDVSPKEGDNVEIGLDLMEGVLTGPLMNAIDARKETVLFADDDPEAALIEMDEAELDTIIAEEFGPEVSEAELDATIAAEFGAEVSEAELDATIAAEFGADKAAPDAAGTIETEA